MSPIPTGRLAAGSCVLLVLLSACAPMSTSDASRVADVETVQTALHGTLLEPPPGWPELNLVGTDGREFSLADRPADEVTVVFFGYTRCPDVCPTTMADLAVARQQLTNAVREHVTVVFVSEDPERDAPQVLRHGWTNSIPPSSDYSVVTRRLEAC